MSKTVLYTAFLVLGLTLLAVIASYLVAHDAYRRRVDR